ncbi:MAG: exodeoxyribonuclease VII small subunit [Balneolaceae bacterium]|nr:exodeoxyribonuclease VII small subunit [Balneolaceae bacterium]
MAEKERLSFEKALSRLETIVEKLDDENLSLEESIELYEEGIVLSKQCSQTLEEAELRIEKVNEEHTQT